jgi:hypothetical protein
VAGVHQFFVEQRPLFEQHPTAEQIQRWVTSPLQDNVTDREPWVPLLVSLQETDVSELTIVNIDLRWCRFAGAYHLDKLKIEGYSPFDSPPDGWRVQLGWPPRGAGLADKYWPRSTISPVADYRDK